MYKEKVTGPSPSAGSGNWFRMPFSRLSRDLPVKTFSPQLAQRLMAQYAYKQIQIRKYWFMGGHRPKRLHVLWIPEKPGGCVTSPVAGN